LFSDRNSRVSARQGVLPMLPYSLTFLVGWSWLFIVWMLLGWPVGPGVPTSLPVSGLTSH